MGGSQFFKYSFIIKDNNTAYAVSGEIDGLQPWYLSLYKSGFYISDVDGQLDEIKLRCGAKYAIFAYNEEDQYSIPKNLGECSLQILGMTKTRFSFTQFNSGS